MTRIIHWAISFNGNHFMNNTMKTGCGRTLRTHQHQPAETTQEVTCKGCITYLLILNNEEHYNE